MSGSNLDIFQRFMMKMPMGLTLKGSDAEKVIRTWKSEGSAIKSKMWDFEVLAEKVEKRLVVLGADILDSASEVRKAKANYLKCENPVAKRRWARRLVIATHLHKYNRESKGRLEVMCGRVKDAIEDSKLVRRLIESRVADAEIYFQLNGRLKLVGKDLAAATSNYAMPEIEYQNTELSMEDIERNLSKRDDETLMLEAQEIVETLVLPEETKSKPKISK